MGRPESRELTGSDGEGDLGWPGEPHEGTGLGWPVDAGTGPATGERARRRGRRRILGSTAA